ncbi:hypothetical protein Poli38472_006740 [Pythium oligandrum]|uniref:N-acetyltransferase domain-containing protein n=1 Tax=Pythium oligandrum TaxID=41045 RepID=A0A8K1FAZ4_PYTOL|nr:hypothetical protein Poli38472_006740 [Pythium oligandrum]|eukprot:TMW56730.1 hypothetical protein Poli38472_006740 [Pythium oligandrum]
MTAEATHTAPHVDKSSVSIEIRSYQPEDLDQVRKMFITGMSKYAEVEGQSEEFWADYVKESLETDLSDIQGTYFESGGHYWVATTIVDKSEVIVGMVGLEGKPNQEGELRRMSVKPEYRRFGVGRILVSHLEKWSRANNVCKIWLTAADAAQQACRFYESLGFSFVQSKPYPAENPYFQVLEYEKRLD